MLPCLFPYLDIDVLINLRVKILSACFASDLPDIQKSRDHIWRVISGLPRCSSLQDPQLEIPHPFDAGFSGQTGHLDQGTQNDALRLFELSSTLPTSPQRLLFVLHIHGNTVPYLLSTREIWVSFISSYKATLTSKLGSVKMKTSSAELVFYLELP